MLFAYRAAEASIASAARVSAVDPGSPQPTGPVPRRGAQARPAPAPRRPRRLGDRRLALEPRADHARLRAHRILDLARGHHRRPDAAVGGLRPARRRAGRPHRPARADDRRHLVRAACMAALVVVVVAGGTVVRIPALARLVRGSRWFDRARRGGFAWWGTRTFRASTFIPAARPGCGDGLCDRLLRACLLRASLVPPEPIRTLRNLTRYRKAQIPGSLPRSRWVAHDARAHRG